MIYTGEMAIKIALVAVPSAAMTIAVLMLNWFNAGPSVTAAAVAIVAVAGGSLLGVFADRLPELRGHVDRHAEPRSR